MALFKQYTSKPKIIKAFQVFSDGEVHMKQKDGSISVLPVKEGEWVIEIDPYAWEVVTNKAFRDSYQIPPACPITRTPSFPQPFILRQQDEDPDWRKKRDISTPWDNPNIVFCSAGTPPMDMTTPATS